MKIKKHIFAFLALAYILGIHKGYVALWVENDAPPVQVYSVPAENLPIADQIALSRGIRIENRDALQHALEDYLS